jgi:hypothetical protein
MADDRERWAEGKFGLEMTTVKGHRRGRISELDDEIVRSVVGMYLRGAKSQRAVERGLDLGRGQLQQWLKHGAQMAEGTFEGKVTAHVRRCDDMYRMVEAAKAGIADELKATLLTMALGVLHKDEDGNPVPGAYRLAPSLPALDRALRNYDKEDWELEKEDLTINRGEGWEAAHAAIEAANEGIEDDDEDE